MSCISLPILYSFRRCPYAIRARLALKISNIKVEHREVVLSNKPIEMLECSSKGTVPVLQLQDGTVIDESRDIMNWALIQNDPYIWLPSNSSQEQESNRLIEINDNEFKAHLDHYKYFDRFPQKSQLEYRTQAESFLQELEHKLKDSPFLLKEEISFCDMAIFPFIRQFASVDKDWFDNSKYVKLNNWLNTLLEQSIFKNAMKKHPQWSKGNKINFL